MASSTATTGRALVVGLGISGITTAIRLRQAGWEPVIVERAPTRRSGGYFIALFGTGQAAARRLGFLDRIPDRYPPNGVTYVVDRSGVRKPGLGFRDAPGTPRMLLRSDVERAAFATLPDDVEIRYATTPTRIEQDESGVEVTLEHDGTTVTERFDLVVGADGLRSTVRRLVFGPHEEHLHRLGYMIAAFLLPGPIGGLAPHEGASLLEPGRALWIFPFEDHPPGALFSYRTDDVDAQFTGRPADRVRAAYGPQAPGRLLGEALDALDATDDFLFDSVEQTRIDTWSRGRVVLVGDSAWCVGLYSGMGVSAGLAGADLLGTMLERHPGDIPAALRAWEDRLRPYIDAYQESGADRRNFVTPRSRLQVALRPMMARSARLPLIGRAAQLIEAGRKANRARQVDIAYVP